MPRRTAATSAPISHDTTRPLRWRSTCRSISDLTARLTAHPAHPALGREGRVAGTRERVIHPNYVVVYDLTADCVRVLRRLHARRQWPEDRS